MKSLLILFLLLPSAWTSYAQSKPDTVLANQFQSRGYSLSGMGLYDSSNIYYEKAAEIYKSARLWENHISALNTMAMNNWKVGRLIESQNLAEQALILGKKNLGEFHQEIIASHTNIAISYAQRGMYDEALSHFLLTEKIAKDIFGENHRRFVITINNIGLLYNLKGFLDKSLFYQIKALDITKRLPRENDLVIGTTLGSIGTIYHYKGENHKALSYHNEALSIKIEVLGQNHPDLTTTFTNIGLSYLKLGEFDQSLLNFQKALSIEINTLGKEYSGISTTYINIGTLYEAKEEYPKALKYYQLALDIVQSNFANNHHNSGTIYANIGNIKNKMGLHSEAIIAYEKARTIKESLYGNVHPDLIIDPLGIGDAYFLKNNPTQALVNYQYSLILNVLDFQDSSIYSNPSLKNFLDQNHLLTSLRKKAEALELLYAEKRDLRDLTFSLETIQLCDTLVEKIRQSHARVSDKIGVGNMSIKVYESAIRISLSLYDLTNEPDYLSLAFNFSERSKSVVLSEKLTSDHARHFASLPDSLLEFEQKIKLDLVFFYSQIQSMKTNESGYDTTQFRHYQKRHFEINNQLDSLKTSLEINFPKYYQLKYQNNTLSLQQVQEKLSSDQALFSYFEGDSTFTVFTATNKDLQVKTVRKDSVLTTQTNQYISSFDWSLVLNQPEKAYDQFTASSHTLYEKLLNPFIIQLDFKIDRLIIVPDGKLSNAPWELFIRSLPKNTQTIDYKHLDYISNDYSISYGSSVSLLFHDFNTKKVTSKKGVLAFAPTYPIDNSQDTSYLTITREFREALVPLKWNNTEIDRIEEHFDGDFYSGSSATEKYFKENASKYQILHLAMHALVDHENPMESKLIFYQDNDSTEDSMLHTYELFNMILSAEMAVLSACKTGLGKLQKGEGVMSLGRAFAYANCPSVVMSHWSVDDESTSQLMSIFYKNLSEGKNKDVAMQHARKAFLEQASIKQHPVYWGGFVVLGNTDPLRSTNGWKYWIIVFIAFLAIISLYFRKINKNHAKNS